MLLRRNNNHCARNLSESSYSVEIRENTDKQKARIWTLFTQWMQILFGNLFLLTHYCLFVKNKLCSKKIYFIQYLYFSIGFFFYCFQINYGEKIIAEWPCEFVRLRKRLYWLSSQILIFTITCVKEMELVLDIVMYWDVFCVFRYVANNLVVLQDYFLNWDCSVAKIFCNKNVSSCKSGFPGHVGRCFFYPVIYFINDRMKRLRKPYCVFWKKYKYELSRLMVCNFTYRELYTHILLVDEMIKLLRKRLSIGKVKIYLM